MHLILIVGAAVIAGIALFGLVVGLGTLAVRWLKLPAEPTEEAVYEPPTPAIVVDGDPAAARARAAGFLAAAALGQRARAVLLHAREVGELAEWVADNRPSSAEEVRNQAKAAATAVEQARAAFAAGDEAALAAAEAAERAAAAHVDALAAGLPDMHAVERRRLIRLTAALFVAVLLAVGAMCLH